MSDIRDAGPRLRQMNDVLEQNERLIGRLAWTERERDSLRKSIQNLRDYVVEQNCEIELLRSENPSTRRIASEFLRRPYCGQNCDDAIRPQSAAKTDTTQPRKGAPSGVPDPDSRVWEAPCTPPPHATPTQGSVQGDGSFRDSQNAKEPLAWALMRHGQAEQVAVHPVYLSGDIHRVEPLYAHQPPMLTAEERDAIQTAMNAYGSDNANPECAAIEATLWGLLERTK